MPRFSDQYPPAAAEIEASTRFRVLGEEKEKEGGEEKKMGGVCSAEGKSRCKREVEIFGGGQTSLSTSTYT
ncbi:hypothetical protein Droror1_Dr00027562, partial [Drosera rotundifolia]